MSGFIKSDRFRRLSREGFWVVLGQVMAVLGALVGVRVLTELLAPAEYGELALGMTVAILVNQVVFGPLSQGVTRFYAPAVERGDLDGYLSAVSRLVLLASGGVTVLVLLIVAGLLVLGASGWIWIAIVTLVFATLSGYSAIFNGIQNAARQRPIVALHQAMEAWMRFSIAAGLIIWLAPTSLVAVIGYVIATIVVLGSQQYMFFKKISPQLIIKADNVNVWQRQIWKYTWPISFFGIFTWAQLVSDRWALGLFSTAQEVGLYAVLFQLGYYPMSMVTGMVMQLLGPIFFQRAGDASDNQRNANVNKLSWKLTISTLGVTGVAFLVALLLHEYVFYVFVAAEYSSVSYLLPWALLAGGIFAAGQTIALNMMSLMKTRIMMEAKIVTALIGVGLNFAGAYWYGIEGVVLAGVAFSLLFLCWMVVLSKNKEIKECL